MAHRILVQVVLTGAQVFGKAFAQAYRQAAAQSAANSTSAGAAATAARRYGVSTQEACRILNVKREGLSTEQLMKQYKHLFDVNSKEKGGSFYLQSKVYRAKETLEAELKPKEPPRTEPPKPETEAKTP